MRTWLDISSLCLCSRRRDIHQWMKPHNTAKTHSGTSNKQKQETFVILFAVMDSSMICGFFVFHNLLILLHGKIFQSQALEMYQGITSLAERCSRSLKGLRSVGEGGASIAGRFGGWRGEPDDVGRISLPFDYELDFKDGGLVKQRWANSALTSFFIAKKRRSTIN